jgi:hypothetical protein
VFLVVALLAVGGALAARLVAAAGPDGRPAPGATGSFGALPDTPALGATGATIGGPSGPTGPTGTTGTVACRRPSAPVELERSALRERAAATALTADYRFQDSPGSSAGDAPDLAPSGDEGELLFVDDATGGQVVLTFSGGSGMSLTPTDDVVDNDRYTIELVFLFRDLTGYAKIIDFRAGSDDSGLYSFDGCLNLYPESLARTRAIREGSFVQVVLTRTASARVDGYVNGVRQFSIRDVDEFAVIDNDDTLWFFRDDRTTQDEFSDGAVARIRLYDRPLTAGEVAALACGELREILSLRTCGRG